MTDITRVQPTLTLNNVVALTGLYPSGSGGSGSSLTIGAIHTYGFDFVDRGSIDTDGTLLPIATNTALFSLMGTTFGGDGRTNFGMPDLDGRLMVGQGQGAGLTNRQIGEFLGAQDTTLTINEMPSPPGNGVAVDVMQSSQTVVWAINTGGLYPSDNSPMTNGYLGVVNAFAVSNDNFALPSGWLPADGRLINIADNVPLFAVIGTIYGGDGSSTFALPDLRGRTPVGTGQGPGLSNVTLGQQFGSEGVALANTNLPGEVGGSSTAFSNYQPSLGLNFLVALTGTYPSPYAATGEVTAPTAGSNYLGEIIAFAGSILPSGWARAEGQFLSTGSSSALYSLFGTRFGGDGNTTFRLPDLRGRAIVDEGTVDGVNYLIGYRTGQETINLVNSDLDAVVVPDIVGDDMANSLPGTGFAERIFGMEDNDTLFGFQGDDRLDGGTGADFMGGGQDDDTYVVDNAGDRVSESAANGTDTVESSINYTLKDNVENLTLTGTARSGYGNELVNTIIGNESANILRGFVGADSISGLGDNDILIGGEDGDALDGGLGIDTAYYVGAATGLTLDLATPGFNTGEAAGDTYTSIENLTGTNMDDIIRGDGFANELRGGGGMDTLVGNAGIDRLIGGADNDILEGGADADRLFGNAGTDTATYANSAAAVTVSIANFRINNGGDATGDRLFSVENLIGSAFDDALNGSNGYNEISGGAGADRIKGYGGNDILSGGGDADIFLFNSALDRNTNVDLITDFTPGIDQIWLDDAYFAGIGAPGPIGATTFIAIGPGADTIPENRIIYEPLNRTLYYDADGSGAEPATLFATFPTGLFLTRADFFIY